MAHKNAEVLLFASFVRVATFTSNMLSYADPEHEFIELRTDVSDEELGEALLKAIRRSRKPSQEEADQAWIDRVVVKRLKAWEKQKIKEFGFKKLAELWRNVKCVSARSEGGVTEFTPSIQDGQKYVFNDSVELESVCVPDKSTAAEVGAAIRLALSRCK